MPPKTPAETADAADLSVANEELDSIRAEAFERGYAQGLIDGKPKLPLFEAAKKLVRDNLNIPWPNVERKIDALVVEYGEKVSSADRGLLINQYDRLHAQISRERRNASQTAGPKPSEVTEYEVVT